jgi:hypothetical protein
VFPLPARSCPTHKQKYNHRFRCPASPRPEEIRGQRFFLVTCPHVNNNPVKYNDPTGHMCNDPDAPNRRCDGSSPNQAANYRGNTTRSTGTVQATAVAPTMVPTQSPTATSSIPPSPPPGWMYSTPTPHTSIGAGPTPTATVTPFPTTAPLTPDQISENANRAGTIKNVVDAVIGGFEDTGKIKFGPGGTFIGFGIDGGIQYFEDASGNYSNTERFMRAGARAFESVIVGGISSPFGVMSGTAVTLLAGPEVYPFGYAVGYLAASTVIATSAEPYMQNRVFPLISASQ